ncbi:hypothetical protein Val02_57110 [Virgisporangium aliadipatigenens]|uniref:Uncharacterized protein n=1 Tax=Virgisporangium aliadipatigenens TaxID=741659 RepID=A0A8J3YRX0_9ACTN|nr:hypothetical protein [Virgisporangium aliadipatigenens]GIJ48825.1 hypothetical protein Val02_57110 [Virgisporangium aliadipatigenens]
MLDLDPLALPVRPVHRADLLWATTLPDLSPVPVVRDRDTGEFVRPAAAEGLDAVALTPDGHNLLARKDQQTRDPRLVLVRLGEERGSYRDLCRNHSSTAAMNPDGVTVANFGDHSDPDIGEHDPNRIVYVDLIDSSSGDSRRLWSTRGDPRSHSACAWSPNGELLAVSFETYDRYETFEDIICVVDRTGAELGRWTWLDLPGAPNATWTNPREFAVRDHDCRICTVSVGSDASIQTSTADTNAFLAVADGHLYGIRTVHEDPRPGHFSIELYVTDLNSHPTTSLAILKQNCSASAFDLLPGR